MKTPPQATNAQQASPWNNIHLKPAAAPVPEEGFDRLVVSGGITSQTESF